MIRFLSTIARDCRLASWITAGAAALSIGLLLFTSSPSFGEAPALPTDSAGIWPHAARHADLEGSLEILHEDWPDGTGHYRHFLTTDAGERVLLKGVPLDQDLQTGDRVRVRGTRSESAVLLQNAAPGGVPTAALQLLSAAPLSNTFGPQKGVVLLVNFTNDQSQPTTAAYMTNELTLSDGFFRENSYQQTSLSADVFGWFTLPITGGFSDSTCPIWDIQTYADQAATQAGINLSLYTKKMYLFPTINVCGFSGASTVGGNPSRTWFNGQPVIGIVNHELGHSYGLYHSHGLYCQPGIVDGTCHTDEYGDSFDTMGRGQGHFNAFQKTRLGWLDYNLAPPVTTVQTTGSYAIDGYETMGTNPKALRIPRGTTGQSFYVELRRNVGWDYYMPPTGVLVHLTADADPNSSWMLDMVPSTTNMSDGILDVGNTFADPLSGITITTMWVNATTAGINVTLGGGGSCVRKNPTVGVSPTSQQGTAGATLSYTVAVTNNDSGCTASNFTQSASVPSGWTVSFASTTLNLAAGATGSTTMQVKSPTSAAAGSYTASATSTNGSASSYQASASATYQIVNSCVRNKPTVKVSPADQQGTAGMALSYAMAVTNNDSGCTSSTFTHSAVVPAGWTASFAASTVVLPSGGTASTTMQVKSATAAPAGTYTIASSTSNTAAPSYTGSTTATYDVPNSGTSGSFTDTFTRPDSSALGNGWTQGAGTFSIASGQALSGTAKQMHVALVPLTGSTQALQADFASVDNNMGPRFGLLVRYQNAQNYHACYRQTGGSSVLRIVKVVNGVETVLKQAGIANPAKESWFTMSCQVSGTTLTMKLGTATLSANTAVLGTGSAGIEAGYPTTGTGTMPQHRIDNVSATAQ